MVLTEEMQGFSFFFFFLVLAAMERGDDGEEMGWRREW